MDTKKPAHRAALSKEDYHKLPGFDGDWRDTWWNDDFLSMMARRWRLEQVQTVLDVGCGVGHWGQRLMRHLGDTATLYGVDAEAAWVEGARKKVLGGLQNIAIGLGWRPEELAGVAHGRNLTDLAGSTGNHHPL